MFRSPKAPVGAGSGAAHALCVAWSRAAPATGPCTYGRGDEAGRGARTAAARPLGPALQKSAPACTHPSNFCSAPTRGKTTTPAPTMGLRKPMLRVRPSVGSR